MLDKEDLRVLGFTMVERGRIARWAQEAFPAGSGSPSDDSDSDPGTPGYQFGAELYNRIHSRRLPAGAPVVLEVDGEALEDDEESGSSNPDKDLDEIEQQADFWCSFISAARVPCDTAVSALRDVRENVLEERFDVTSERLREVYNDMQRMTPGRAPSVQALGDGLRRCGLVGLDDAAVAQLIEAVRPDRSGKLTLAAFETILSRLKMAQLFVWPSLTSSSSLETPSFSPASVRLRVVEYNSHQCHAADITHPKFREFCFGHRVGPASPHEGPLVRWVHVPEFDLTTLLCLTVKYCLHPLGVEDVIEQCPTKIDRYGCNYFAAVEQLCLVSDAPPLREGGAPVRAAGYHVAAFCSGPPLFDTVITIAQPDRSFAHDWPGEANAPANGGQCWAEKLRHRLTSAPRSRLRERRADFILYQLVDLSTDELQALIRAYSARRRYMAEMPGRDFCAEASACCLQLKVVIRRVRGLQRTIRRFGGDPDFSAELAGYLQDVAEHLDEAHEDAANLIEKFTAIMEAHHHAMERKDEKVRQHTADRLNKTLTILTVGTFIFAPMQFMAGVYGMNFVNENGRPTMPELLWNNGYLLFWILILSYLAVTICFVTRWYFRVKRESEEEARGGSAPAGCDMLV
uniref:EF-hand domain-containing protein n=1 Tax=Zooxanthella nutricula TaxID=1333877 RepID=A0A7S2NAC1_9DINO